MALPLRHSAPVLLGWSRWWSTVLQSDAERRQPDEVRAELLHVLYGKPSNVLIVGVSGALCGLYAYFRQGALPALILGFTGLVLVLMRCALILKFSRRFLKARCSDRDPWYAAFGLTAIGSSIAWGGLSFDCMAFSRDPALYTMALVATTATGGAIAARNAAAPRIARLQLLVMLLPVMVAAPMTDHRAYDFLFLLVPAMLYGFFVLNTDINEQLVQSYRSQIKLAALSNIDYLTQISNRRYFGECSSDALDRCRALQQPMAILMIDVDYFKNYNDHYGHQAGDVCLQQVAAILKEHLRHAGDVVSRYGGEEFAVSLQNANAREAEMVAQRLCDAVAAAAIPHAHRGDGSGRVTVSIGAVATDQLYVGLDALVHSADRALYQAKHGGRNRIAVAHSFANAA